MAVLRDSRLLKHATSVALLDISLVTAPKALALARLLGKNVISAAKLDIWLVTAPTRTVVVATEAVTVVEVATAIAERAFPAAAGDICHVTV